MPTPLKYKKGDTVRGLKLIEESHKIYGDTPVFAWLCKNFKNGEWHVLTTQELSRHKRAPISKYEAQLHRIYGAYKRRSRMRNNFFDLSKDEFKKLTQQNCTYCDAKPLHGKLPYLYNGLDRKDSSLGYIRENVVPCCSRCNGIKSNLLTFNEMKIAMSAIKRARKK